MRGIWPAITTTEPLGLLEGTEKTRGAAEGSATPNTEVTETESFANNLQKFHVCDSETASFMECRRVCCMSNVAPMSGVFVQTCTSQQSADSSAYSKISIALDFSSQESLNQTEPLTPYGPVWPRTNSNRSKAWKPGQQGPSQVSNTYQSPFVSVWLKH